jgi:hypothetical protein
LVNEGGTDMRRGKESGHQCFKRFLCMILKVGDALSHNSLRSW